MIAPRLRYELRKVLAAAATASSMADLLADAKVQNDITMIECDIDALEMIEMRSISTLKAGQNPGAASSFVKLRFTEVRQAITRLGMELTGAWAQVRTAGDDVADEGNYLNSRAQSIYGGSAEIQRNILATAMLGL